MHCITNYVTVHECASVLLAAGASPVMADAVCEAADITGISDALLLNMGTFNPTTAEAMKLARKRAGEKGIPVVFDPVGAGASRSRAQLAADMIRDNPPEIIRGNVSEILNLLNGEGGARGVDADEADAGRDPAGAAAALAKRTGAVVAVSGATDYISDGETVCAVRNGTPLMAGITGSGCMLGAYIAAAAGANPGNLFAAVRCACIAFAAAGEIAEERLRSIPGGGCATYNICLIDAVGNLQWSDVTERMKYEEFTA